MIVKQIIALGGGGFSMEPDNHLLDRYILAQSAKRNPKICFLPTASGDSSQYIARFYQCFERFACRPTHLSLFKPPNDLHTFVQDQDIFYVGGGNTRNLLILWREWGLDHILRAAWERGAILTGLSAGSICWFEQGITDSIPNPDHTLTSIPCLGFLPGSHCPHYDGEQNRRPSYHRLLKQHLIKDGLAADDGVGLHFINHSLHQVVSSRPNAKAYQVAKRNRTVTEEVVQPTYLGDYFD